MKKLTPAFAAAVVAAALVPAISMAQDAPTTAPKQEKVQAVGFGVPVQACTTNGFSEEAVIGVIAAEDDVTAAGGADKVFSDDLKKAAVKELADAWKAVIGGMTADELGTEGPSDQFKASVKEHLKTVSDDLSKKAHVHILVVPLQVAAPTEGCPAPAQP